MEVLVPEEILQAAREPSEGGAVRVSWRSPVPREIDGDYLAILRQRRQKAAPGMATAPQAMNEEEALSLALNS
jgi:hypothetical protein